MYYELVFVKDCPLICTSESIVVSRTQQGYHFLDEIELRARNIILQDGIDTFPT